MDLPTAQLMQNYGWSKIEKWRIFSSGHMNTNVYVKADCSEYNVRFYKSRQFTEIEFEIEALEKLYATGFSCPLPIAAQNKEKIVKINATPVVCFSFIPGETSQPQNIENVKKVARKAAEFHLKSRKIKLLKTRVGETMKEFKQFVVQSEQEFIKLSYYCKTVAPIVRQELNGLELPSNLEIGLVHNDIKPENVVFNNGEVAGVLDFDLSYFGDLLSDVASAALWWSIDEERVKPENVATFLRSYEEVRPLSAEEKHGFKTALLFQALKQVWRYPYFVRQKPKVARRNSEMFLRAAKWIKNDFNL